MAENNQMRGEIALRIGSVDLTIAVTFAGLAKLSRMINADSLDAIYRRLLGFEPWAASCAIKAFVIDDGGPEMAQAKVVRAIEQISTADEEAFRTAISAALTGHLEEGRKRQMPEKTLEQEIDEVEKSLAGEPDRPSA